jgi:hypothetical protein
MAIDLGLRIMQLLNSIGIKPGTFLGKASNVKKAFTGGKPTFFKPDVLETLRATDGNFSDALKLIEEEAQFIVNATDAEKMAFLNNLMEYKSLGGPQKTKSGITALDQAKNLTDEAGDLQTSIDDLVGTAKSMKDDAEAGLASAKKDLNDFFTTGGQPLKAKSDKFLGGSMHEEGQLRTGIREFLKTEYKNGRLKLNDLDKERIMQYSPMLEHDPIKVFKKIYGEDAYTKAGSFPGAFEKGENFNHYEQIFRENMGEDVLKVKNNEYKGDGKLVLTEREEVFTPTPDDDVPFAEGGRARFAGGGQLKRIVQEIVEYITTKFTPIDAMKEINKVISKTGKYKNLKLTQKDIDEIIENSNDFIFQRDPENKFVEGSIKERTEYLDDADKAETFFPKTNINKSVDEMSVEESLTTLEGLGGTKMAERFRLKQKYPGLDDDLLTNIIEDPDPLHKAKVLAKIDQAMELTKRGKNVDETIQILESEPKQEMASGGLAAMLGEPQGYYTGGMVDVEPNLSDIGHGSDALMARTRLVSPDGQATTSTGLNYLLAEDNDNIRVPFDNGKIVKKREEEMGPSFETNDPKKAIKEVIQRLINVEPGRIPLSENMQLMFDSDRAQIGGEKKLFGGEIQFGINKGFGRDDLGYGFNFKKEFAEGGIAGLRQGYSKGKGVDFARRGFLKVVGGTVGAIAALKSGALKLLGKTPKAIPKIVEIGKGSGVPDWFEPMVNKVLADGLDVTKGNAVVDGQVVKRIDTPNGQVDVYHNQRSGEIDVEYASESHAALGDSVHLNYKPGMSMADEGAPNPPDEFMASEVIPEGRQTGPDDFDIEMGENTVDEVGGLFSDTSELEKLGGGNINMREILKNIEKKKKLKKMNDNPTEFVTDVQGDYDPT